jgi:general secretion pathway protein G
MVELMAVLVIVGLLFAVAAGNLMGQADKARVTTTKASLKILHQAVLQYKMDTGQYPTEEEGLMVLIERPMDVNSWDPAGYLESTELPVDGWGNDFVYRLNPPSEKPFDVVSYGANGEDDGELYDDDEDAKNYDKDLSSTDAN